MITNTGHSIKTADDGNRYELVRGILTMMSPPSDASSDVEAKAENWLTAGTCLVLVVDPSNLTFRVCKDASHIQVLRSGDIFDSGDICSNWTLSVDDAFQIERT